MQFELTQIDTASAVTEQEKRGFARPAARNGFLGVLLAVLAFLVFFFYNFQTVVVSGKSMLPTLKNRQHILLCKALWLVGPIKQNDIVVLKMGDPSRSEFLVKRVWAVGGDVIKDVTLSPIGWNYFQDGYYRVPEGKVYVLGDNRLASEDSRLFGPVNERNIIGKVVWY